MMENNKKYYPYEKSDEFDILFEDNKFCVVFGKAEKGRIKSVGIRWLVDISEEKRTIGYPLICKTENSKIIKKPCYVRIYDPLIIDFLKSLLKLDFKGINESKIKEAIEYFKNLKEHK
jgi:hypothetical protein